jgi:RecA-family ATPase
MRDAMVNIRDPKKRPDRTILMGRKNRDKEIQMTLREKAIEYLKNRYEEEAFKYPLMRKDVTLNGYVQANLKYAMRNIRNKERNA